MVVGRPTQMHLHHHVHHVHHVHGSSHFGSSHFKLKKPTEILFCFALLRPESAEFAETSIVLCSGGSE